MAETAERRPQRQPVANDIDGTITNEREEHQASAPPFFAVSAWFLRPYSERHDEWRHRERTADEAARDAWFAELNANLEALERAAADTSPLKDVSPLEEPEGDA